MSLGKRKRRGMKQSTRKRRKLDDNYITFTTIPIDLSVKTRMVLTSSCERFRKEFVEMLNKHLKGFSAPLFVRCRTNFFQYYQTSQCLLYKVNQNQGAVPERDEDEDDDEEEEEEDEEEEEKEKQVKEKGMYDRLKMHNQQKMREFSDSFVSLYKLFQAGSVPFFYFVSDPFIHVLFLSSVVHGSKKVSITVRCDPNFRDEFYRVVEEDLRIYYYHRYDRLSCMKLDNYSKIHHIFDYLLNDYIPSEVLSTKNNEAYPRLPVLYSPIPFLNSTCRCTTMSNYRQKLMKKKKKKRIIRKRKKKKKKKKIDDDYEEEEEELLVEEEEEEEEEESYYLHEVEINGMIFPHTFNNILLFLFEKDIPFKLVECETLEESTVFNLLPIQTDQSQYEDVFWKRHLKMSQKVISWDKMKQFRSFTASSDDFEDIMQQKYIDRVEFHGGNAVLIKSSNPQTFDLNNPDEEQEQRQDEENEKEGIVEESKDVDDLTDD